MVIVTVGDESYYVEKKLVDKWNTIKNGKLTKLDDDRVYITDGRERSGKSVFTLQQAACIDPSIIERDIPRITFSPEDTLKAIRETKSTKTETKVIVFDEAFRGMSSKSALSKVNKSLVQAMMEMGQNNLVLFIVSPSFFLLELYPAMLRSEALFHIYKDKRNPKKRGFKVFNHKKKGILYRIGVKKGWGYPVYTKFKGRFFNKYPGGEEFKKKYLAKKLKSLQEMDKKGKEIEKVSRFQEQRDILIKLLKEEKKLSLRKLSVWLKGSGVELSKDMLSIITRKNTENVVKVSNV